MKLFITVDFLDLRGFQIPIVNPYEHQARTFLQPQIMLQSPGYPTLTATKTGSTCWVSLPTNGTAEVIVLDFTQKNHQDRSFCLLRDDSETCLNRSTSRHLKMTTNRTFMIGITKGLRGRFWILLKGTYNSKIYLKCNMHFSITLTLSSAVFSYICHNVVNHRKKEFK